MAIPVENNLETRNLEKSAKVDQIKRDRENAFKDKAAPADDTDYRVDLSDESLSASSQLKSTQKAGRTGNSQPVEMNEDQAIQMAKEVQQELAKLDQGIAGTAVQGIIHQLA
jgi:hypothetical protein